MLNFLLSTPPNSYGAQERAKAQPTRLSLATAKHLLGKVIGKAHENQIILPKKQRFLSLIDLF